MKAITQDCIRPSPASFYGNYKCFPIIPYSQSVSVLKVMWQNFFSFVWFTNILTGFEKYHDASYSYKDVPFLVNLRNTVWNLNLRCSVLFKKRLTVCLLVYSSVRPSVRSSAVCLFHPNNFPPVFFPPGTIPLPSMQCTCIIFDTIFKVIINVAVMCQFINMLFYFLHC